MGELRNWAGNVRFTATELHRPTSVADLRQVVASATRARALGTGHSFNRVADTTGDLISLADLPASIDIDSDARTVRTSAGIRYGTLGTYLHDHGFALRNLASLPHISVAGAVATATHGSGVGNQNLAAAVRGQEFVAADGSLVTIDAADPAFGGTVVGLGSLGVLTHLTLAVVEDFQVRQYVYDDLDFTEFYQNYREVLEAAYSVSLFTDWRRKRFNAVWLKDTDDVARAPGSWFGARPADGPRHPVPGLDGSVCSVQGGVPGPWHERLPHFRLEFTPSSGAELQSEYILPREHLCAALRVLERLSGSIAPVLQICEIRTVAADELWLSMNYRRDSCAFHFTWHPDAHAVAPVLVDVEAALAEFDARPHWGKVHSIGSARLAELYERLPDFHTLRATLDPRGKFANDFTTRLGL